MGFEFEFVLVRFGQ